MDHDRTPAARALLEHFDKLFPAGDATLLPPWPGPISDTVPSLRILCLTPPEGGRLYATVGLWDVTQREGHGLEFLLHAPAADDVHVETLSMVAHYHAGGGDYTLGLGHTVPIGRPWLPGSQCDHLLVSLPYPWGPDLELCTLPAGHAQVLWLLPITEAEKIYRHAHDLEALEQRLETAAIHPRDPLRPSAV
ncbi:suppressor of fused domain protein [Actinoplanes oblitus]|uniref:Suppressor of fused domain protein n=1 Tax=Actinoplanes oblitus TaxID=3040509 RepID=A0ABY8WSN9_9ACTN|nr:suppressor of fused domain protein [Actinoplanes oblitus]WIN00644.1 suppressor of fused domain protein [Actinoplanes oblitus]